MEEHEVTVLNSALGVPLQQQQQRALQQQSLQPSLITTSASQVEAGFNSSNERLNTNPSLKELEQALYVQVEQPDGAVDVAMASKYFEQLVVDAERHAQGLDWIGLDWIGLDWIGSIG